jgi:IMP dehydrogenase
VTSMSFDDVLLVPRYSDIESRKVLTTSNKLGSIGLGLPIISSPMDTVTETHMALAVDNHGGLGIVHRYNSIDEQATIVKELSASICKNIGAAVGVTGDFLERAQELVGCGANIICIDVAHGHHSMTKAALHALKLTLGQPVHLMAGNVATGKGACDLAEWGADSVRVGVGGGSICSTRLVSGHGVPTFQSVIDCVDAGCPVPIIADGGMASSEAQVSWRGKTSTPEGISTTIPYKGDVNTILADLKGGIQSGMSYSGARTINDLQAKARFVQQTTAGQAESFTHILMRNK